jgi:hypothetical protein
MLLCSALSAAQGLFPLCLRSNLRVVTEVARSLEFAPAIVAMADRIVAKIGKSAHAYNAVHLRIEKDARDWSQIMGGPEVRLWSSRLWCNEVTSSLKPGIRVFASRTIAIHDCTVQYVVCLTGCLGLTSVP